MSFDKLSKLEYSDNLLEVGKSKMVGYLPLSTIGKDNVSNYVEWTQKNG